MTRISSSVVICIVVVAILWPAATAHSAAQMGLPPDQYDKGIPVYWPYHAGLMSAGLLFLLAGFIVMHYHRTVSWYRSHMILQSAGGTLAIAGLVSSYSMVAISGAPHFRYLHDILGIITVLIIISMIVLGFAVNGPFRENTHARTTHRWIGRFAIILVIVNIVLGVTMMSMVLAQ